MDVGNSFAVIQLKNRFDFITALMVTITLRPLFFVISIETK